MKTVFMIMFLFTNSLLFSRHSAIPVYIEDSHAGSFFFLAEELDFSKKYTLINFDMHSDATALINSDLIRESLRKYKKSHFYDRYLDILRKSDEIQCYNWIEPLIDLCIDEVWWVYPGTENITDLKTALSRQIDKFEEISPRRNGSYYEKFRITDFNALKAFDMGSRNIVFSIDLDYFSQMNEKEFSIKINEIISYIAQNKKVNAITASISGPYLKDTQVNHFTAVYLDLLSNIVNSRVFFNNRTYRINDTSNLAKTYRKKNKTVRYFVPDSYDSELKSVLLKKSNRIKTAVDIDKNIPVNRLSNNSGPVKNEITCFGQDFRLYSAEKQDWYILLPKNSSFNIAENKDFASGSPDIILYSPEKIKTASSEIDYDDVKKYLNYGFGTVFIYCINSGNIHSQIHSVVFRPKEKNYMSNTAEIFNLPYIYGSTMLSENGRTGSDLKYGSDCSSFLIYGKRKEGYEIAYCNPGNLKKYLNYISEIDFLRQKHVAVTDSQISNGIVIHFGRHVCALFKDNYPYNEINSDDLIIHQLEDFPRIVTLGEIMKKYRYGDVYCFKNDLKRISQK